MDFTKEVTNRITGYMGRELLRCQCNAVFPELIKGWAVDKERTTNVCGIYFECIDLFLKFIQNGRNYVQLDIIE